MAESTSPVGRGTAGLLLINGMPLPPLSDEGPGDAASRGRNGHENVGDDGTSLPEEGLGALIGEAPGDGDGGGDTEFETFMARF